MEIISAYIANDGTIFKTIDECNEYEIEQKNIQNNLEIELLNSIIAGIAVIQQQKCGSVEVDKIKLICADSVEELANNILDGNIIVINKNINKWIVNELFSNGKSQRNAWIKIKNILSNHRLSSPVIFLKVDENWYSSDELIKRSQNTIQSIKQLTKTLIEKV